MLQFVVLQAFARKARKTDLAQEKAVMVNDCVCTVVSYHLAVSKHKHINH